MLTRRLLERRSWVGVARACAGQAVRAAGTRERERAAVGLQERGTSTLEFAMALPLLAAMTVALCGVVLLTREAVLAQGAAREGARAAAVSGDQSLAAAAARAALPAGRDATVTVSRLGSDRVKVEVWLSLSMPYADRIRIPAEAVAAVEPGEPRTATGSIP
jgi:hypothetical protein